MKTLDVSIVLSGKSGKPGINGTDGIDQQTATDGFKFKF
jgi:hypothetical protein